MYSKYLKKWVGVGYICCLLTFSILLVSSGLKINTEANQTNSILASIETTDYNKKSALTAPINDSGIRYDIAIPAVLEIKCPPKLQVQCSQDVPDPDTNAVMVGSSNEVEEFIVKFEGDISDKKSCPETITRTYSVTDSSGKTYYCTQLIIVNDTVRPQIEDLVDFTLQGCNANWPEYLKTKWNDNCTEGGYLDSDAGVDDGTSNDGCIQYRLYTFNKTDDCGNPDKETTRVAREYDMTDPEIEDLPDFTLEGCNANWPEYLKTKWNDNCAEGGYVDSDAGGEITTSEDGCTQSREYTFTVSDNCGNSDTETTTVTRTNDITDPEIVDLSDITLDCNAEWPLKLTTTWTDNCAEGGSLDSDAGGEITTSEDGCTQSRVYTFTVTDNCGNSDTETTTVTRTNDITDPEIVDLSDITLDCNAEWPLKLTTTWTDNCAEGGSLDSDAGGEVTTSEDGCTQSRVYTFTVTDNCGNSDTETTTVTRTNDITDPEIVDLSDITLDCNSEWPLKLTTTWTDNCADGGTLDSDAGGEITTSEDGCTQSRVYTFTVTDNCENSDTETTTVSRIYDIVPPEIVDLPDISLGCNAEWPLKLTTTWTDNCAEGGSLDSDAGGEITTSEDGCTQSRVYTFTVTDNCENSDTETTTVSRIYDIVPPEIVDLPDISLGCNAEWPKYLSTTWTDNCAEGGEIDSDAGGEITTSEDGCTQSRVYTFTVTDNCENSDTETTTVSRIYDIVPPEIVDLPDISLGCNAEWPKYLSTTWTDNCAEGGEIDSDAGGEITTSEDGCTQSRVYTFTVTDNCENSDTETTTVTRIYDIIPPEIVDLPDIALGCNANWPKYLSTTWTDNCAEGGSLESYAVGDVTTSEDGCTQSRVYSFTVTDDCENTVTETTTVSRTFDITDPEIVDLSDITLGCNEEWPLKLTTTWTDNCAEGGSLDSDAGGEITTSEDGCTQSRVYTFTVTDDCENSDIETTTVSRTFDITDPEIVDLSDITLGCNADWPEFLTTTWTDNCADGGPLDSDAGGEITTSEDGCTQSRVYTFTVTDDCENSDIETTTVSRTFDTINPEILDLEDDTLEGCDVDWPEFLTTTWTDNCAVGDTIDSDAGVDDGTSEDECIEYRLYTFMVTDDCGNSDMETTRVGREVSCIQSIDLELCIDENVNIDLFSQLTGNYDPSGDWQVTSGNATINGSIFNPSSLLDENGDFDESQLGEYIFTYMTNGECPSEIDVIITLGDYCIEIPCTDQISSLIISTALTPNGDGINDVFEAGFDEEFREFGCTMNVQIFNRWGSKIFEDKDYKNDWRGNVQANAFGSAGTITTGTYFYVIRFESDGNVFATKTGYFYVATK